MKFTLPALCLLLLIACTPRGQITLDPAAVTVGEVEKIFIGTTRAQDQSGAFGSKRSEEVRFAQYEVSVPPDRKPGNIKWPLRGQKVDPQKHFLTTTEQVYQTTPRLSGRSAPAVGGDRRRGDHLCPWL